MLTLLQKGLIGMDPPPERYLEPIERFWGLKKKVKPKVSRQFMQVIYILLLFCISIAILMHTFIYSSHLAKGLSERSVCVRALSWLHYHTLER